MIRLRVVCRTDELDLALARLRQSFSTVTPSAAVRVGCCEQHIRVQVRATF